MGWKDWVKRGIGAAEVGVGIATANPALALSGAGTLAGSAKKDSGGGLGIPGMGGASKAPAQPPQPTTPVVPKAEPTPPPQAPSFDSSTSAKQSRRRDLRPYGLTRPE